MDFDFSEDQKLLRDQARRFLADSCPPATVHAVLEGDAEKRDALWRSLAVQGFVGATIPEELGGLGAGVLDLCVIAEELGRAVAPAPFLSSIYLVAELIAKGGSGEQCRRILPQLASGELIGCLALAEGPGQPNLNAVKARIVGGRLNGVKLPVLDGDTAGIAIVGARDTDGEARLFLVDLAGQGVMREPVQTIDPTRGQARLVFKNAPAEILGEGREHNALLRTVFDHAAVLAAFEQVGGAERALEMARDYALERMAFGRPIGSFQAVKHMLADMYVSATLARSNAYYGAWALSTGAADLPVAAASARVSATHAFQHCARNAIQVHGGMGFTWESPCHLFYRRSNLLAVALGGLSHWERLLVERMRLRRNQVH